MPRATTRWAVGHWPLWAKLVGSFVIVLLLAIGQAAYAYRTILANHEASDRVEHTYRVIALAGDTRAGLSALRSAYRSFLLTGSDPFYQSYLAAQRDYRAALQTLQAETADNPAQVERWQQVAQLALEWERDVAQPRIDARRATGRAGDPTDVGLGANSSQNVEIDRLFAEALGLERQLLDERKQRADAARRQLVVVLVSGIVLTALVSLGLATLLATSIGGGFAELAAAARQIAAGRLSERIKLDRDDEIGQTARAFNAMADQLEQANSELTNQIAELQERDHESSWLAETGELLQACNSLEEAQQVLSSALPQLLPGVPVAACVINESENFAEVLARSDAAAATESVFGPDECWALRLGRPHRALRAAGDVFCSHVVEPPPDISLCLPMVAQGRSLGLLHVALVMEAPGSIERPFRATERIAVTLAHQVGLAVANLKLRHTLRIQALRDSLTGLFNRRYFEDTLERELSRAQRKGTPLSLVMLDIDHFKQLNDTFGHHAGDEVLRQLARTLRAEIRASDLACRYGGEEFMLILPDAELEHAAQRADHIREAIGQIPPTPERLTYGPITVSMGVVAFPQHGRTVESLVQAADRSLYHAKRGGRNRIETEEPREPAAG